MTRFIFAIAMAGVLGRECRAARCTTVLDPRVLREYQSYVAAVELTMSSRFDSPELPWVADPARGEAAAELAAGKLVRRNISDGNLNRRIAGQDGTVIHWVGAVRIRGATLADLKSVLEDYGGYDTLYRPMIFDWRAARIPDAPAPSYDATFGLHNTFRFASVFPQKYSFQVKARIDHEDPGGNAPALRIHLRSSEIRESDSGVPGRSDLLEPYRDHGIMWALNAYWRARQSGPDVYFEFETITLARSVEAFVCRIGIVPVPKAVVSSVMESLPGESLEVILRATRAECERRGPAASVRVQR